MGRETELSKSVADLLQVMKRAGKVIWHDRLQSGRVPVKKGPYQHWMRLCKNGTPDRYAILANGLVLWLEIKRPTERLEEKQMDFKRMIERLPGHVHMTVRHIDQLKEFFGLT